MFWLLAGTLFGTVFFALRLFSLLFFFLNQLLKISKINSEVFYSLYFNASSFLFCKAPLYPSSS